MAYLIRRRLGRIVAYLKKTEDTQAGSTITWTIYPKEAEAFLTEKAAEGRIKQLKEREYKPHPMALDIVAREDAQQGEIGGRKWGSFKAT